MGDIRPRGKKGTLHIRYYDRNHRQREESAHTTDREVAKNLLKEREGAIAKGSAISPQIGRYRFEDAEADLIADYVLNDHDSLEHVKRRIRIGLKPWFGGRRMASITVSDIRRYAQQRKTEEGASNATINRELSALKRMFSLAMQAGKLLHRPHIPMLAERNARRGFFEPAAFEAIRSHLPPFLQPVADVACYTGWRVKSEILALEWRHVDREAQTIRLDPGMAKNEDGRLVTYGPIPALVAAIEACWAAHVALEDDDLIRPWVFVRWTGKKRRGTRVKVWRKPWLKACRLAGQPGRIPHDFRRTMVRNLERSGVGRSVAKSIVGHKTDAIYNRYAIVNEPDVAEAMTRLSLGLEVAAEARRALEQGQKQGQIGFRGQYGQKAGGRKLRSVK